MDRYVTNKILFGPKLLRSISIFFGDEVHIIFFVDGLVHILPYDPK
jgi:hypothetical protein